MDLVSLLSQADFAALAAIQTMVNPALSSLMLLLTYLGNPIFWVIVAAAIYWHGRENESFFLMNLVLFSAAAVGALKFAFARPRPSKALFQVLASDSYASPAFPSGHSCMIAGAFSYSYSFIKRNAKALFAVVVALVAFSRLYLGMHFPSDVVAGVAIGLVIGRVNVLARNRLFHRNFRLSRLEDELMLVAILAAAVIAVIFLQPIPLSAAMLGFYAGFFLFREMELQQGKTGRNLYIIKLFFGLAFLGAVLVGTQDITIAQIVVTRVEQFALYFIAGFWISWGWPVLFERICSRAKKQ